MAAAPGESCAEVDEDLLRELDRGLMSISVVGGREEGEEEEEGGFKSPGWLGFELWCRTAVLY